MQGEPGRRKSLEASKRTTNKSIFGLFYFLSPETSRARKESLLFLFEFLVSFEVQAYLQDGFSTKAEEKKQQIKTFFLIQTPWPNVASVCFANNGI